MSNYKTILDSYRNLGEDEQVFSDLFEKFDRKALLNAKSCIIVGPGTGVNEINFLQMFAPHLSELVCIERDESCAITLLQNLDKNLSREVQTRVVQIPVQLWKGPEEKVDVVLMFHCLYYFSDGERYEILRKCLEDWLKLGGRLYVMMIKDVNEGERHLMNEVYREQGGKLLTEAFHVKKDLEALGHRIEEEHYYQNFKNLKRIDDGFIEFLKYHSDPTLLADDIKQILERISTKGNRGLCTGSLFSVLKTN